MPVSLHEAQRQGDECHVIDLEVYLIRVINYYCNLSLFQVFVGSKPYSTKPMEELLKSEFGDLKMYQLKDTKYATNMITTMHGSQLIVVARLQGFCHGHDGRQESP